jgi:tRNA-specific 2-thiouridylase
MTDKGTVVVAMSGGVDSSVTAALLVEQGYSVIGMMMRLWSEPGSEHANRCCTPSAMAMARKIADQLEIPFYAVDAKDTFHDTIVDYFIVGYTQGVTPNPCMMCNRHIRWEFLLNQALALGADYMATGHYAKLIREPGKPVRLFRAKDKNKDQSYVLSVLNQSQLRHALFPLGDYTKPEVREIAARHGLPVAKTKDSQDLCFLAGTDYPSFLARNAPEVAVAGPILRANGEVVGKHTGLAFYTIGQRKGLGIAYSEPLYVVEKDIARNALIVGTLNELGQDELKAHNANWVSGSVPDQAFNAGVMTRYTSSPRPALVIPEPVDDAFSVLFDEPQRDITPGQSAVIYMDDEAIGSGIIAGEGNREQQLKPIRLLQISGA